MNCKISALRGGSEFCRSKNTHTVDATTTTALATVPVNRGPNRVGADPRGKKKRKPSSSSKPASTTKRKRAPRAPRIADEDRLPNTGVIDLLEDGDKPVEEDAPMPISSKCQSTFIEFMCHWQGKKFAKDQQFRPSQLRRIRPYHIVAFFHKKAFGKEKVNYKSNDDRCLYQRRKSVQRAKSAISHCMPDQDTAWNYRDNYGNPTRAKEVNAVLERMGELEKHDLGAPSQAKRDVFPEEFLLLKKLFREVQGCFTHVVLYCCYSVLAFHLIFRSDNVSWLKVQDIRQHPRFNFGLHLKVKCGKNMKGSRECPPQIVLGSMNTDLCPLLHLAIHTEMWLQMGNGSPGYKESSLFVKDTKKDGLGVPRGPKKINERFQCVCTKHFHGTRLMTDMIEKNGGELGSHSIRKYAATHARRFGHSPADVDFRGCWKSDKDNQHKVVVDSYINPEFEYLDASVCSSMCDGQPVAYRRHKDAHGVTARWMLDNVVPFCRDFYKMGPDPRNPSLVLAHPLLWAALSPEMEGKMDEEQRQKIRAAYDQVATLPDGVNPVVRVHLRVHRVRTNLMVDEVLPEVVAAPVGGVGATDGEAPSVAAADAGVLPHATVQHNGSSGLTPADLKLMTDMMFQHHQQVVGVLANQDRSNQTCLSNMRSEMDARLVQLNNNLCM